MNWGRKLSEFRDSLSNTILASELCADQDDRTGHARRGIWAFPFMGSAIYLHRDTPNTSVPDCMAGQQCGDPALVTAPCNSACTYQGSYTAARSYHPGGVNAILGDGSVTFYDDGIDLAVWQALATLDGGEVISQ